MKITYLSSAKLPSRFANSIQVMKMCQAFAVNGHEVHLLAQKYEGLATNIHKYYGVDECFDITLSKRPDVRIIGAIIYAINLRRESKNIVDTDIYYGRNIYALVAVSYKNIPLIFEAHTPPQNFVQKYIEGWLFQRRVFKNLVVISMALKYEYMRIYPFLSDEKIIVAHDGADLPQESSDSHILKLNSTGRMCVGYIGHLYKGKGVEIVVQLAKKIPDMDFHVVGGTESDIAYWSSKSKLKNLVFHGFVPHSDLGRYFDCFDVVLAPYQYTVTVGGGEGDVARWMSPLKIFEYMAHGKAIVSSDLPVLKEVFEGGMNSLLCKPDNLKEWEDALYKLRTEPDLRLQIGLCAKEHFLAKYTWKKRAELVLS